MTGLAAVSDSIASSETEVTEALDDLVQQHARFVFRVAYSVLRNRADAEDATQETFLRVLRHRHEIPGVRNVRAWLARIAWHIATDRRRRFEPAADEDSAGKLAQLAAKAAAADAVVISAQMLELAERVIAGLPGDLRNVLTLSAIEDMTSTEIAAALDIPEASVRTRLMRARQLVRQKLAKLLEPHV